jgi:hypothetical protein
VVSIQVFDAKQVLARRTEEFNYTLQFTEKKGLSPALFSTA